MASLNKVFLIGNLTRDPQLRYTPNGTAVTDFGIAINRTWTGQDGQRREETVFVDVTLWARQAEVASEYLHKGAHVFIEGRLKLDQWTDKDGQKRSRLTVVGERMQLLGTRAAGERQAPAQEQPPIDEPPPEPVEPPPPADDIPF